MNKKVVTIFPIIVVVIFSVFMIYRYNQYIMVWQANNKINVSGIKLMMTENEVKRIIGEEEVYISGFGGYKLEYLSKGIFLTFLNDKDTDFYCKVNQIEVIDSKYEVFGIKVGDEFDKAVNIIYKQGFTQDEDSFSGYWRINMYVILDKDHNKVKKITVGVRDSVSSNRIY